MPNNNYSQYTPEQQIILALLAYTCLSKHFDPYDEKWEFKADTAAHAAALLNIPDDVIWDVRQGKIKGLQNLNRIATVVYFESDYEFKP